jgi:hypothetical protein
MADTGTRSHHNATIHGANADANHWRSVRIPLIAARIGVSLRASSRPGIGRDRRPLGARASGTWMAFLAIVYRLHSGVRGVHDARKVADYCPGLFRVEVCI